MRHVQADEIALITERLCDLTANSEDSVRDIAALSLKSILLSVPSADKSGLVDKLVPRILGLVADPRINQDLLLDYLDILAVVLKRFGSRVSATARMHIFSTLIKLLENKRAAIRKRVVTALGAWVELAQGPYFAEAVSWLEGSFASTNSEANKISIQCLSAFT